jgi:hypothetical protein
MRSGTTQEGEGGLAAVRSIAGVSSGRPLGTASIAALGIAMPADTDSLRFTTTVNVYPSASQSCAADTRVAGADARWHSDAAAER